MSDIEALRFARAFLSGAVLPREQLVAIAIRAVQELNRIDGALPCLRRDVVEESKRPYVATDSACPVRTRCGDDDNFHARRKNVWSVQHERNHGSACFYGTTSIEGKKIDLCPHEEQEGR